jgi:hypothetical protein
MIEFRKRFLEQSFERKDPPILYLRPLLVQMGSPTPQPSICRSWTWEKIVRMILSHRHGILQEHASIARGSFVSDAGSICGIH